MLNDVIADLEDTITVIDKFKARRVRISMSQDTWTILRHKFVYDPTMMPWCLDLVINNFISKLTLISHWNKEPLPEDLLPNEVFIEDCVTVVKLF